MIEGHVLPTKVLCQEITKGDKVTPSGILISANVVAKDPCITAIVKIAGSGSDQMKMPVVAGQTILFNPHVFQRVRIEEEDYLLLDARDILFFY